MRAMVRDASGESSIGRQLRNVKNWAVHSKPSSGQRGAGRAVGRIGDRRHQPGWVCAIRPDGYVGYIGEASGLHDYLSRCLVAGSDRPRLDESAGRTISSERCGSAQPPLLKLVAISISSQLVLRAG